MCAAELTVAVGRNEAEPEDFRRDESRALSLSDGVFAFSMTLMVLTLSQPEPGRVATDDLARAVLDQVPSLVSYFFSFIVIAFFWQAHRRVFRYVTHHDTFVEWLNVLFLFSVSFLPYPTDIAGDYNDQRFSVVFYGASIWLTSTLLSLLWWYVSKDRRFLHARVPVQLINYQQARGLIIPFVALLSIGVSFASLNAAWLCWLLVPVGQIAVRQRYRAL